jgi:hypothetical protein
MYFSKAQFEFIENIIFNKIEHLSITKDHYKNLLQLDNSNSYNKSILLGKITSCKDAIEVIEQIPHELNSKNNINSTDLFFNELIQLLASLRKLNEQLNNNNIDSLIKLFSDRAENHRQSMLSAGLNLQDESE